MLDKAVIPIRMKIAFVPPDFAASKPLNISISTNKLTKNGMILASIEKPIIPATSSKSNLPMMTSPLIFVKFILPAKKKESNALPLDYISVLSPDSFAKGMKNPTFAKEPCRINILVNHSKIILFHSQIF